MRLAAQSQTSTQRQGSYSIRRISPSGSSVTPSENSSGSNNSGRENSNNSEGELAVLVVLYHISNYSLIFYIFLYIYTYLYVYVPIYLNLYVYFPCVCFFFQLSVYVLDIFPSFFSHFISIPLIREFFISLPLSSFSITRVSRSNIPYKNFFSFFFLHVYYYYLDYFS